jgi:large subunit ribosomal protein L30
MRFIEIKQIRSPIRRHREQRATLIGLGLNRIGRIRWVLDTPASRGTIDKVSHLVKMRAAPGASSCGSPIGMMTSYATFGLFDHPSEEINDCG